MVKVAQTSLLIDVPMPDGIWEAFPTIVDVFTHHLSFPVKMLPTLFQTRFLKKATLAAHVSVQQQAAQLNITQYLAPKLV